MIQSSAKLIRLEIRAGRVTGPTSGLAAGYVQANVAIVPAEYADDFARFCNANRGACPLLYRSAPGQFLLSALGQDLDIRSDVPRYQIHRNGKHCEEVTDLAEYWREDLVTFAIGCSFSFEEVLITAGLEIRNVSQGRNVPMYRTSITCETRGPFHGNLVVDMRPFRAQQLDLVRDISARYPLLHGAPLPYRDPAELGIADLQQPDFGDAVSIAEDEVPVFWACGVTAREALRNAGLDFCITHSPGHMLVTDRLTSELENLSPGGEPVWR